jgi:hypothetical protein
LPTKGATLSTSNDEHETGAESFEVSNRASPSTEASRYVIDLEVSWLVPSDLSAVDMLARLHVAVSRYGCVLRLHRVEGGLAELLDFVGLSDVMNLCPCHGPGCRAAGPDAGEPPPS